MKQFTEIKMIKMIKYNKNLTKPIFYILAFILSLIHILVVKNRDKVTFHWPDTPRIHMYVILILAVLFCYLFYFIFCVVVHKLITRNKVFLSYFKHFCFYFIFMSVFWLLTWPGIFKGDEFYVIRSSLEFGLSGAQSGITSIFYIVCMLFFPSMATITFVQLLIICSIFAVVMHDMQELLPFAGKLRFLLYVPFLFLPVIDANLFTLRCTLAGWIFLYVISKVFYFVKKNTFQLRQYILLALLTGLLCAWRSECAYLILLLPLSLLLLRQINIQKALYMMLLIVLFYTILCIPNKIALNGSNKYAISLVLNPLGNLFTEYETLKGPHVYEDIMTINELIDVPLLRKTASVRNISQYWNIDDVLPRQQLHSFMKAACRLLLYNPDKFLKYRFLTFAHTNGLYPDEINHPGGESIESINQLIYYGTDYKSRFVFMNPPLGQSLREKTISFLACRTYEKDNIKTNIFLPVFYNCIPGIFLLLIGLVAAFIKKNKLFITMIFTTGAQLVLIFLTAPAMFFMYYFSFYLCSWFLTFLGILYLINERRRKKQVSVN